MDEGFQGLFVSCLLLCCRCRRGASGVFSRVLQCRLSVGLREDLMGWDVHKGDKLAHYARACTDITFQFPFGTQELMGIAARGDYDLTQHTTGSGKSKWDAEWNCLDEATCSYFVPLLR